MTELEIPETAREFWFKCGCDSCDREGYAEGSLPIIVAAELRRLAEGADERASDASYGAPFEVTDALLNEAKLLRQRADELDKWGVGR